MGLLCGLRQGNPVIPFWFACVHLPMWQHLAFVDVVQHTTNQFVYWLGGSLKNCYWTRLNYWSCTCVRLYFCLHHSYECFVLTERLGGGACYSNLVLKFPPSPVVGVSSHCTQPVLPGFPCPLVLQATNSSVKRSVCAANCQVLWLIVKRVRRISMVSFWDLNSRPSEYQSDVLATKLVGGEDKSSCAIVHIPTIATAQNLSQIQAVGFVRRGMWHHIFAKSCDLVTFLAILEHI